MQPIAKSGYFFGLLAIFLWSWNVIISRYLAPFIPPFQISFFRWFIAGICLLPFTYKQVLKEKITLLKSWKIVLFLSVGLAFMNNFIYQAGHSTSAIDMSLLATMGPVLMVIFSWIFFRVSLSKRQIIGFLITFLGVLIVISGGKISAFQDFRFAAGNLWMLVFAIFFGLYGAFERKRPQNLSQISFLSVTITVGTLTLLPFFLTTLDKNPLSNIGIVQWGLLAYLGIVNSIFGYLAWNIALSRIGSLRAGLLYYLLPLFSSIEAFFVLDEHLALGELIGAAFVFSGIIVGSMCKKSAS